MKSLLATIATLLIVFALAQDARATNFAQACDGYCGGQQVVQNVYQQQVQFVPIQQKFVQRQFVQRQRVQQRVQFVPIQRNFVQQNVYGVRSIQRAPVVFVQPQRRSLLGRIFR